MWGEIRREQDLSEHGNALHDGHDGGDLFEQRRLGFPCRPDQGQHDGHLDQGAYDRCECHGRAEGRDGDGDGDLEIPSRGVEGHGHGVLVVQSHLPAREIHHGEHDPEKDRHRDGHLENDHGPLQDEIPFQGKHDDQREEKPDDGKRVQVGLEFLEPLLAHPAHRDAAGQESGDKRQPQVKKDAFANDEDVEGHFPQQQFRVDRDQQHLADGVDGHQDDGQRVVAQGEKGEDDDHGDAGRKPVEHETDVEIMIARKEYLGQEEA